MKSVSANALTSRPETSSRYNVYCPPCIPIREEVLSSMCLFTRVFLTLLALLGVFSSSQAAYALTFSSPSGIQAEPVILGSKCTSQTSQIPYAGGYSYNGVFPERWASGEVYVCYTKLKFLNGDKDGDYYAMQAQSFWTYESGDRNYPARMYQFIASDKKTIDNRYGATNSFTSSESCSKPFSVGFQIGPISISTDQALCDRYTVNRTDYTSNRANWTSSRAGGLRTIETVYAQKVPKGVVPRFEVHFAIPQYRHYWNNLYWETKEDFYWVDYNGL